MQKRVRVRRERPSALSWAIALAATMLAVYLITLSVPGSGPAEEADAGAGRVTREVSIEGMTIYLADLGCYADDASARIAAAALTGRGAAGVVRADADGWHVLGAGYDNEADAVRIAGQLGEREGLPAQVMKLSTAGVSLRITAPESDIDAIAGAERALRAQLAQTATLALQVDRGEVTSGSARTLAALSRSELTDAAKRLRAVDGAERDAVCAGLLALMEHLAEGLDGASRGNDSGAALSGRLRCCHVDGCVRLIEWLNALRR